MVFWTWARGLEDDFDGKNRKNPRHFIVSRSSARKVQGENEKDTTGFSKERDDSAPPVADLTYRNTGIAVTGATSDAESTATDDSLTFVDDTNQEEMDIVRLPTCAVFHKLTAGRGVPHSFYGFIKQMPALPRLVVSVWDCF